MIWLGVGTMATEATLPRATCPPLGVSIGSCSSAVTLLRVAGVLHAATMISSSLEAISDIGSLAIMIAASRRTSPGVSPYLAAAAVLTVTSACGMNSSGAGCTSSRPCSFGHARRQLVAERGERVDVRALDVDGDVLGGAVGEHLVDPLVQVGLHVAERARVGVGDVPQLVHGGVVVGARLERQPRLREVDAGDFLAEQGLADVAAGVG